MNKKISDKDKKDWQNFVSGKEKLLNKDLYSNSNVKKSEDFFKKILSPYIDILDDPNQIDFNIFPKNK